MDEIRLKAFEDMLAAVLAQYDATVQKMDKLKAEGKGENCYLSSAFCQQAAIAGDIVLL